MGLGKKSSKWVSKNACVPDGGTLVASLDLGCRSVDRKRGFCAGALDVEFLSFRRNFGGAVYGNATDLDLGVRIRSGAGEAEEAD